jgi:hypothetical protein
LDGMNDSRPIECAVPTPYRCVAHSAHFKIWGSVRSVRHTIRVAAHSIRSVVYEQRIKKCAAVVLSVRMDPHTTPSIRAVNQLTKSL